MLVGVTFTAAARKGEVALTLMVWPTRWTRAQSATTNENLNDALWCGSSVMGSAFGEVIADISRSGRVMPSRRNQPPSTAADRIVVATSPSFVMVLTVQKRRLCWSQPPPLSSVLTRGVR